MNENLFRHVPAEDLKELLLAFVHDPAENKIAAQVLEALLEKKFEEGRNLGYEEGQS